MAHASHDDDLSVKALQKRYEGLVTVRTKAIKGKGAWYWAHLEPILVQNQNTGAAKAVKLRCGLCAALFSASNPSRTASEHLKRGTCPNFNGAVPKPLACAPPLHSNPPPPPPPQHRTSQTSRKRAASVAASASAAVAASASVTATAALPAPPLSTSAAAVEDIFIPRIRNASNVSPLLLSGGKEDLDALALLEDNVKKLRSPCGTKAPNQSLSKGQIDSALNLLAEWLYESGGAVSFSCIEHPKFKAFLNLVGLPPVSRRYLAGPKLDAKFEEVRVESEARLRDAMFFQLSSDGWQKRATCMGETLINVTLNLPNGTSLFHKAVTINGSSLSSKVAEDTLWEAVVSACDSALERCVGIVADADNHTLKALQDLEFKNSWMINLSCQIRGFSGLLKSFYKHVTLFRTIEDECRKVTNFFASKPPAWHYLQKFQGDDLDTVKLLRTPPPNMQFPGHSQYLHAIAIAEEIASSARVLQMAGMDDSFKMAYADDPLGREIVEMVSGMRFWSDLEAVLSLVKLVKLTIQELETERPSISQCLPLWVDLRTKIKDWCARYAKDEACIDEVIEKRFNKNYHPAWSAAFILDPLYLIRDTSGKYLPPFKCLTTEQEKDVDRLITRLVSREEAHIAVMELLKWRVNGLDPLYAQAVQMKERDPATGKLKPVTPQSRRLVWETCLSEFKVLGKVAIRLIFLHATSSNLKSNWSIWKWVYRNGNTRLAAERAQKMIYIASHARLYHKDFTSEEDKDAELFAFDDDEVIPDEVFINNTL